MVENAAFGHTDITQTLLNGCIIKSFDTLRADRGNGGTFLQLNHKHIAVTFESNITEKTGAKERVNSRIALGIGKFIADLERQVRQHRTRFGTGDALNSDILNNKIRGGCKSSTR